MRAYGNMGGWVICDSLPCPRTRLCRSGHERRLDCQGRWLFYQNRGSPPADCVNTALSLEWRMETQQRPTYLGTNIIRKASPSYKCYIPRYKTACGPRCGTLRAEYIRAATVYWTLMLTLHLGVGAPMVARSWGCEMVYPAP